VKYLLDTEVWLWMQAHPDRIGHHTMNILADEQNKLLLSAASAWEIARKFRKGHLQLFDSPDRYVPDRLLTSGVEGLALELSHALRVTRLDDHHADPIDRLLVAQGTIEQATLISADMRLAAYDIEFIDARH
jgi:PIN domain nuclease of toxin-antitoxin system